MQHDWARRNDYLFSVLEKLPVVPIGDTGTIPFAMNQHAEDFVGKAFDTREEIWGIGRQQQIVVHQQVGLELVSRTLREVKKGIVSSHHYTSKIL